MFYCARRFFPKTSFRWAGVVAIASLEFVLAVDPPDGERYEARANALVSRLDVPSIQPGRIFPVKFDPKDRNRVAIYARASSE